MGDDDNNNNVVHISSNSDSAELYDPEASLTELLEMVKSGELDVNKMITIAVNDTEDGIEVTLYNAKIYGLEVIAVLDLAKQNMLAHMGYA